MSAHVALCIYSQHKFRFQYVSFIAKVLYFVAVVTSAVVVCQWHGEVQQEVHGSNIVTESSEQQHTHLYIHQLQSKTMR